MVKISGGGGGGTGNEKLGICRYSHFTHCNRYYDGYLRFFLIKDKFKFSFHYSHFPYIEILFTTKSGK